MAAQSIPKSFTAAVVLNVGTSAAGKTLTRSVSLGSIRTGADVQGILDVAETLVPCLAYPALRVVTRATNYVEDGD